MPSTPPTWSTTAATCTSACVSTPAVTEHVVSTMVIAIPSCSTGSRGGTHLPGGCREPGTVEPDPEPVPHPTGECRLRAGRRIVRRTTSVSRFESQTNPKTKPTVDTPTPRDGGCRRPEHPRSSLCRVWARGALGAPRPAKCASGCGAPARACRYGAFVRAEVLGVRWAFGWITERAICRGHRLAPSHPLWRGRPRPLRRHRHHSLPRRLAPLP